MKRFGYVRDPVCLAAVAAYAVNRWLLPLALRGPFLREHFNDVLLIPAALPPLLWLQRRLRLRAHDDPPRWSEIGFHAVAWSLAAEVIAPHLFARATADVWDVAAYAAGAVAAGWLWSRP